MTKADNFHRLLGHVPALRFVNAHVEVIVVKFEHQLKKCKKIVFITLAHNL